MVHYYNLDTYDLDMKHYYNSDTYDTPSSKTYGDANYGVSDSNYDRFICSAPDYTPIVTWYFAETICLFLQLLCFLCTFYILRCKSNSSTSATVHLVFQMIWPAAAIFFAVFNIVKFVNLGYSEHVVKEMFRMYAYVCGVPFSSIGLALWAAAVIAEVNKMGRLVCSGVSVLFLSFSCICQILMLSMIPSVPGFSWMWTAGPVVQLCLALYLIIANLNYLCKTMDFPSVVNYVLTIVQGILAICCLVFSIVGFANLIKFINLDHVGKNPMTSSVLLYYAGYIFIGLTICCFTILQLFGHIMRLAKKNILPLTEQQPLMQGAPVVTGGMPTYQPPLVSGFVPGSDNGGGVAKVMLICGVVSTCFAVLSGVFAFVLTWNL